MSKLVQFKDVPVEKSFKMNGVDYIKIPEIRLSCCSVLNAAHASDINNKIQVLPLTEVEIEDQ